MSRARRAARRRGSRAAWAAAAAAAGTLLAGCSGYSGSLGHQVAQWANGASLGANDALVLGDFAHVEAGIGRRELVATHTACDGLASDAATAYGELPTPDSTLTDALDHAYLDAANAAQACTSASGFGTRALARYRKDAAASKAAFATAKARLAALGVR